MDEDFFFDGRKHHNAFEDMYEAILNAKHFVYITGQFVGCLVHVS